MSEREWLEGLRPEDEREHYDQQGDWVTVNIDDPTNWPERLVVVVAAVLSEHVIPIRACSRHDFQMKDTAEACLEAPWYPKGDSCQSRDAWLLLDAAFGITEDT